jgi:hypothetical protein
MLINIGDIIDLNLKFSWAISSVNVELVLHVSETLTDHLTQFSLV